MERLFLSILVIGIIAAPKALPPPRSLRSWARLTVSLSRIYFIQIKNYASKLGTLEGTVKSINHSGQLQYNFTLSNADCQKVSLAQISSFIQLIEKITISTTIFSSHQNFF
ncbi:unnamed protein product [Haemonchus placei]|uniref:Secreted protein n=1 Tax=Haemonchus placei TaxID=6290 RepID=A0A0N4WT06_HAEPC|nr:unnamed protein product [Haemonchus placei]